MQNHQALLRCSRPLCVLGLLAASAAHAQPSFTIVPPDAGYDYAVIQDVVSNGSAVLVSLQQSQSRPGFPLKGYLLNLLTSQRTDILDPFGRDLNPIAANTDGSTVVGSLATGGFGNSSAFRWTDEGVEELGGLPAGNLSYATGVSGNGQIIVGTTGANSGDPYQQGWRWTNTLGFEPLTDLGTDILIFGSAEDISANGSTIVGFGSVGDFDGDTDDLASAAYWPGSPTSPVDLGNLPNPQPTLGGALATAVSGDGSVIVGFSPAFTATGGFTNRGWRYTSATGLVDLGAFPGRPNASIYISDISTDGGTIVGYAIDGGVNTWESIVWTAATGYRSVRQILADAGVIIPANIRLREASCSGDGRIIAGWAYNSTTTRYVGYIANLGPAAAACLADVTGDNVVDGDDFIAFINSFSLGSPGIDALADVAGAGPSGLEPDGVIDGSDFIAFINAFAAGC